jgi:topoisomerase-4 subunit A
MDNKPVFFGVSELLKISTKYTKSLLLKELNHRLIENEKKWHNLSLERIFIENRLYRNIEEIEEWDKVLSTINISLKPFTNHLKKDINSA